MIREWIQEKKVVDAQHLHVCSIPGGAGDALEMMERLCQQIGYYKAPPPPDNKEPPPSDNRSRAEKLADAIHFELDDRMESKPIARDRLIALIEETYGRDDKWEAFKNYLHNELGISREDIREWLKQAVEEEAKRMVAKTFDNFDIAKIAEIIMRSKVYVGGSDFRTELLSKVAAKLGGLLELKVK